MKPFHVRRRSRFYLWLLSTLSLLALLAACGGGGGGSSTPADTSPVLKSITVTPADSVVSVGTTRQFAAAGTYSDGKTSALSTGVTWSVAGSNATMGSTGLVTGKAPGTETVIATVGTVKGTATLTVRAPWVAMAAGGSHSVARKADGSLVSFGWNRSGQLGDGSTIDRNAPVQVSGGALTWTVVAAGEFHTLALRADGTLWAWGFNQNGQLGDGSTVDRAVPVKVGTSTKWVAIAAGKAHSLGVQSDGTLWAWGRNFSGQLGDNTVADKLAPVKINAVGTWKDVAAGETHSVARQTNGAVYAWGGNDHGQVGNNTVITQKTPVQVGSGINFVSIAAGGAHTLAIRQDGALFAWGANEAGQAGLDLADGVLDALEPAQVGVDANWALAAAGGMHSMGIRTDGTLWTWGANGDGQLGDGTFAGNVHPKKVGAATTWTAIAAGKGHSFGLQADGSLWTWGRGLEGQLGDARLVNNPVPAALP